MRVRRVDEQLNDLEKPALYAVESVILGNGDGVITCAGFEDRSLAVLRATRGSGDTSSRIVIVEYRPQAVGNRVEDCLKECARLGLIPVRYVYDRENPEGAADDIWKSLSGLTGRIYIDISGMSRLLIVQLIATMVYFRGGFDQVTVLYGEAENYFPSSQEFKDLTAGDSKAMPLQFLSWGVSQITVVPELSSTALQEQPTHLIAFPTLDPQQLTAVRSDVDPTALTLIEGRPLHEEDRWRLDAVQQVNQIGSIQGIDRITTSTYDYRETLGVLLALYAGEGRLQRLVVCPTGSKLQTVAVGLFRAFLDDIRIVYPTPKAFRSDAYTSGVRQLYRLDLDAFSALIDQAEISHEVRSGSDPSR